MYSNRMLIGFKLPKGKCTKYCSTHRLGWALDIDPALLAISLESKKKVSYIHQTLQHSHCRNPASEWLDAVVDHESCTVSSGKTFVNRNARSKVSWDRLRLAIGQRMPNWLVTGDESEMTEDWGQMPAKNAWGTLAMHQPKQTFSTSLHDGLLTMLWIWRGLAVQHLHAKSKCINPSQNATLQNTCLQIFPK